MPDKSTGGYLEGLCENDMKVAKNDKTRKENVERDITTYSTKQQRTLVGWCCVSLFLWRWVIAPKCTVHTLLLSLLIPAADTRLILGEQAVGTGT